MYNLSSIKISCNLGNNFAIKNNKFDPPGLVCSLDKIEKVCDSTLLSTIELTLRLRLTGFITLKRVDELNKIKISYKVNKSLDGLGLIGFEISNNLVNFISWIGSKLISLLIFICNLVYILHPGKKI